MMHEQTFLRRWLGELPIYGLALALFALCAALLSQHGVYPSIGPMLVNLRLFMAAIISVLVIDIVVFLATKRPDSPITAIKSRYFSANARQRMVACVPLLAVCIMLLPFFSKMKAAIPLFNDYTWDTTFIAWDRAIFFGYDAWEVMQPVLGFPIVTATLAVFYHLWMLLLYPGCLFFAFAKIDPMLRRQFFMTYVLSWTVIGGAMATWMASVGPCFVGPMLGNDTFDAQMAYLNAANEQVPVMTLKVQAMLLDWFHQSANGLGSGITAMPSMHIAICFLFWLAMRQVDRRLGHAFAAFLVIIWIGSVHLAYHYAVDGLVSAVAVAAIWWISGNAIRAWDAWLARSSTAPVSLAPNAAPAE